MSSYQSYKDSGVDWIRLIPSSWGMRKIKYLFKIKKRISGELGHDVLSITQNGIKVKDITSGQGQLSMDYSKYQFVEVGDFSMNHMDLLTGYVDLSKYNGVTSPDYRVFSLIDKNNISKYFLYLFQLGYINKIFFGYGQGSSQLGRWRFPTNQFKNFKFPYPDLKIQQNISTYLDQKTIQIDSLIEKTLKKIELLKEQRTSLINHVITKGLDPDVEMKNSGIKWIGSIPQQWEIKKLKYISTILPSNVDKHIYPDEIQVNLCNYTDVYYNDFITSKIKLKKGSCNQQEHIKFKLHKNDILITKDSESRNDIGIPSFIPEELDNVVCGYHLSLIRPRNVLGGIVFRFIQSNNTRQYFEVNCNGITRFGLGKNTIENLFIPIPPHDEQQEIVDYINTETSKINSLVEKETKRIDLLKEYRQSLITEVVTGKIDVRDEVLQ